MVRAVIGCSGDYRRRLPNSLRQIPARRHIRSLRTDQKIAGIFKVRLDSSVLRHLIDGIFRVIPSVGIIRLGITLETMVIVGGVCLGLLPVIIFLREHDLVFLVIVSADKKVRAEQASVLVSVPDPHTSRQDRHRGSSSGGQHRDPLQIIFRFLMVFHFFSFSVRPISFRIFSKSIGFEKWPFIPLAMDSL